MGLFNFSKPKDERLEQKVHDLEQKIADKKRELEEIQQEINIANETIDLQEVGFYERRYSFSNSQEYSEKLKEIRDDEKQLVKDKKAVSVVFQMTMNNSQSKGRALQNQLIRAAIRGFNGEADALLTKITVSNVDKKVSALKRAAVQLNKMYQRNGIELSDEYVNKKIDELYLAAEYEQMKQDEKDKLREVRQQERENKKLQAEIAEKRKQLKKERDHYSKIVDELSEKILKNPDDIDELKKQLAEYQSQLDEINQAEEDVDYREGHATAGYVYVISNIGSFGEDVYKIGVTRRLDPYERINELGSASVPFKFDVHAMVFSEDAFSLETALHNRFDKKKINKVNSRKEYFNVPLQDIKSAIMEFENVSPEFTDDAEAFEYRQSQKVTD